MSRIGKKAVQIPAKVEIKVSGTQLHAKGPKGELDLQIHRNVTVEKSDKELVVAPVNESAEARALWGLTRTLVSNMVTGVSEGFTKDLELVGVGYKAQAAGDKLTLNLGYSHPIEFQLPKGITASVKGNVIQIAGCNKELVGMVAAKVRDFRSPEPYKGKGIKYVGEVILRKAGKTGKK